MKTYDSAPKVLVEFSSQGDAALGSVTLQASPGWDSLIAVSTSKDLKQPCGRFRVTMVPQRVPTMRRWRDFLRPGDLVTIRMGSDRPQPGAALRTPPDEVVMIGSIDDIREQTALDRDGRPQRTLTVQGRDLAKYLVDDQFWFDSLLQPGQPANKIGDLLNQWFKSGQTPGQAAGYIAAMVKYLGANYPVAFNTDRRLSLFQDILRYSLDATGPTVQYSLNLDTYRGSVWSLMEQVTSRPFYVLGYDVRRQSEIEQIMLQSTTGTTGLQRFQPNGKTREDNGVARTWGGYGEQPCLLLYRNPWPNREYSADWTNLPTRVVRFEDLISSDLGRTNDEVSNTWRAWSDAQGLFKVAAVEQFEVDSMHDRDSIRRYGERPMFLTTPFLSGNIHNQVENDDPQRLITKALTHRLKDWNRWNEWYLNGTLSMKGMAQLKVGDRLWLWDEDYGRVSGENSFSGGIDFYVEGVAQEFRSFSGWTTDVHVTRGQQHMDKGEGLDFTDVILTDADLLDRNSRNMQEMNRLSNQVRVWAQSLEGR